MSDTPTTSVLVRELLGPALTGLLANRDLHMTKPQAAEAALGYAEAAAQAFQHCYVVRRREHSNGNGNGRG